MTPGPDYILACPYCGALARYPTFESDEPIAGISWTDGYQRIPGVPRAANIARCQSCHQMYWTGRAQQVGFLYPGEEALAEKAGWDQLPRIEPLDEEDYLEAIHGSFAKTPEEETELRVHAWWRSNDVFREKEDSGRYHTDAERVENMKRIIELTEEGDHELVLFRAEAFRHLGRFDEAEEVLYGLCSDYALAREKILALLREKSRDLEVLFVPEGG